LTENESFNNESLLTFEREKGRLIKLNFWLQAKKKMVEFIQEIIQSKRGSGVPEVARDVADVLLSDTSEQLTDDLVSDNMIDLMIPGEDSVPVLMTLAVKYLSDCPTALHQLTVCAFFQIFFPFYLLSVRTDP